MDNTFIFQIYKSILLLTAVSLKRLRNLENHFTIIFKTCYGTIHEKKLIFEKPSKVKGIIILKSDFR